MSTDDLKIIRPEKGTRIEGIEHAIISCRECKKKAVVHQTEKHNATMVSVKGNVIIDIQKPYTVNKNNPI